MASRLSEDPHVRVLLIEAGGRSVVTCSDKLGFPGHWYPDVGALTHSDFENLNISVPGRASTLLRSKFVRAQSWTRPCRQ